MTVVPASSRAGAAGASATSQLADQILGVAGTFSFTAIPQTYNHLLILAQIRLANATTFDDLVMQLNADAAAHYGSQYDRGNQATASAGEVVTTATPAIARVPAASATAGFAAALEIWLPNYASTTLLKQAVCSCAGGNALTTGTMVAQVGAVLFNTAGAVSRIDLFGATTANAVAGSRATLYGVT